MEKAESCCACTGERRQRILIVVLVSAVFFSDQMLTTVIIPILHDQLCKAGGAAVSARSGDAWNSSSWSSAGAAAAAAAADNSSRNYTAVDGLAVTVCAESEVKIQSAFLVGLKGLVQIAMNPVIGKLIDLLFPAVILLVGIIADCASILLYGLGDTYWVFMLARGINGVGSAAIGTSGLAQVADSFPSLRMRNRAIGIANFILFSANALGPTYGGFIYERTGRTVVFLAYLPLFFGTACLLVPLLRRGLVRVRHQHLSHHSMDQQTAALSSLPPQSANNHHQPPMNDDSDKLVTVESPERPKPTPLWRLLVDPYILACAGGLIVANLSHNCLAATLGIWMHHRFDATDTQKGLVWLPTLPFHFAATVGSVWLCNRLPASRGWVAAGGLVVGGTACALLPFMPSKLWCTLPIGLVFASIAVLDVALLPLLSHLVDKRYTPVYGSVSCIAHASFSIATAFGAFAAGPIFLHLGFSYLFVILCGVCVVYAPIVLVTSRQYHQLEDSCGQQQQQKQQDDEPHNQLPQSHVAA